MEWVEEVVDDGKHLEYREGHHNLFLIILTSMGKVMMYDWYGNSNKLYRFSSVEEAKSIAIQSINDKRILLQYEDSAYEKQQREYNRLMAIGNKILKQEKRTNERLRFPAKE